MSFLAKVDMFKANAGDESEWGLDILMI